MGTVTLETDRLILRRLTENDACDMYNNWASDEKVTKYLRWLPHKSVEESKFVLENIFLPNYADENYLCWGIELKENHQLIGTLEVRESGEVGYALGEKYWCRGIVTEALKCVVKYCFEQLGMVRLWGFHATENPASGRVMEKAGMKYEGFSKKSYRTGYGEYHDCKCYGITDDMYFDREGIGFDKLIKAAQAVTGSRTMSAYVVAGSVGAALLTGKNNIYTGVCINTIESGLCAEQSAVAAMVTAGESRIKKLVCIDIRGTICPPCEKCCRLMASLCPDNLDAEIAIGENKIVRLGELAQGRTENNIMILESERLNLVPLTERNIPEIFESFTDDVTTYMFPSAPKHISETEAFVGTTYSKMEKGKEMVFAIRLKENDEFIGLVGIHNIPSGSPEIGIWTKKAAHGSGYGFEAVSRAINHIRRCIPYDHIVYPVDRRNHPSRRIPIMHGGQLMRQYEVVNMNGKTLEIVEYWIK